MKHEADLYALVIGRVVATLRERREWSQNALAEHASITQSTLSRIERGQVIPDVYVFRALARSFGTPVAKLHDQVETAFQRTKVAAQGATQGSPQNLTGWEAAFAVAGIVGMMGLVAFAVAVALEGQ